MSTVELFVVAMIIIFALPWLVWRFCRTDYWAPLVVVQIITGIVLGPGVVGAAFPALHELVFKPDVILALNGVAWWAVMVFVFVAGIELDLVQAWAHRGETLVTAGCAMIVPLLLGAASAGLFLLHGADGLDAAGWIGTAAQPWQFVAGMGMACAVTALPILILLMEKMAILRLPLGQRILRYASVDDVAIWAVLALILVDWTRVGRQVIFVAAFTAAAFGVRHLMRKLQEQDRWYVAIIWLSLIAFAADWSGLHFMVGAFLAGAVLEISWFGLERIDQLRRHVLMFLMPVFFLSTGLRTTWESGGAEVFAVAGLLLTAAVIGKLGGVYLAGHFLRWARGEAWLVGWLLQTKALIMIIFANVLLDKSIISQQTFTALLLMAVASTMLTVPVVTPLLRRMPELTGKDGESIRS
jgi:Kef-type K+ transport system membrane component KefB